MYSQTTNRKFYGPYIDPFHKFDTSLSHMLNGLFINCDIRLISSYLTHITPPPHLDIRLANTNIAAYIENTHQEMLWNNHFKFHI